MKKSKLLILGVIALLLAVGLTLASCGPIYRAETDCVDNNCHRKQNKCGRQCDGVEEPSSMGKSCSDACK